jgi:hypothetical protein
MASQWKNKLLSAFDQFGKPTTSQEATTSTSTPTTTTPTATTDPSTTTATTTTTTTVAPITTPPNIVSSSDAGPPVRTPDDLAQLEDVVKLLRECVAQGEAENAALKRQISTLEIDVAFWKSESYQQLVSCLGI